ncbi:hypothetical protein P5673_000714 [Acropora cervicornis]|uniref:Uncharacterized protein n=1 Tax=Acropora cervicornis TaxID=6130 RepID=A0AAD9VI38_ACRCE|nr:hypothetical protein P5673_000714 [Acropora cervicornis]
MEETLIFSKMNTKLIGLLLAVTVLANTFRVSESFFPANNTGRKRSGFRSLENNEDSSPEDGSLREVKKARADLRSDFCELAKRTCN